MSSGGLADLRAALAPAPWFQELWPSLPGLGLPHATIVAGAVAQTVWNHLTGRPAGHGMADLDIVYFDPDDLSPAAEQAAEARLAGRFPGLQVRLDVKNQARVHLWYEARFGRAIRPYRSVDEAIATYPTTATAIGIRPDGAGGMTCCAPFGMADLFALVVRPNYRLVSQAIYEAKARRWRTMWPELRIVPWNSADPIGASADSGVAIPP